MQNATQSEAVLVVRAFQDEAHHSSPSPGLPLSLFTPYKNLPPDGQLIPIEEAKCDPAQSNCKTPTYVYEDKCHVCNGTGTARGIANGRRGALCTCVVCTGLGYVRRTTTRFIPTAPSEDGNAQVTLLRNVQVEQPLPPKSKPKPKHHHHGHHNAPKKK
eukprot:CAMPEP_0202900420 /NCGR_PEP_ID=MMETSP1392-20130828/11578_1 /ASSEMBLY_ACC=CAM_ASM_000868 /TAXON_ID=225041 /ORGANISM="Chlamydomonas chlamydogama, Strain SAG 11-48b" /LENGTH=158 /DNA_ID=CAMNT_0049586803 /DNA_START=182 /DNA_END=659 /DNA_ORIENTATION=-